MQALYGVLAQQSDGASFLWELRARAVSAPHYNLADLAKLDQRLEAHIDGLRIAGNAGWDLCKQALTTGGSGEVFAAAVLAFESNDQHRVKFVLEAGTPTPELSEGLISALGWLNFSQAEPHIKQLLDSAPAALKRVGIAAAAIHRRDPGPPLTAAIASPDPLLKSPALRAIGELGLATHLPQAEKCLADENELCRVWAAWSLALLSTDPKPLAILTSIQRYSETALQLMTRRNGLLPAKPVRNAIIAAGARGDPANIPWLIEQMSQPALARVAGEAFTMITGVDIAYQDLDANKPENFEAGPTEDPEDQNVEMDPDENLPWPAPQRIAGRWTQIQASFRNGTRYLLGQPISPAWCDHVLRLGRQRQRAAAALELAILRPGQPLFDVAAPGFRQQQLLGLRR